MAKPVRTLEKKLILCATTWQIVCSNNDAHRFELVLREFHGDPGLRFRKSHLSRGLSAAGARSIARLARPCVWSISFQSWRCFFFFFFFFFFAFFDPTIGRRLAFACFPFFFDHFDWQKLFSNQKKWPCKRSEPLPASVVGSSYLSSSKVKNKDRWTTNGIDRTVSVEHTERPSSRKAWLEKEGHFPCPAHGTGLWQTFKPQLSFQSRTSKPDYTWTPTSTGWEILRTRCKQSSISFSKDEALRKI